MYATQYTVYTLHIIYFIAYCIMYNVYGFSLRCRYITLNVVLQII